MRIIQSDPRAREKPCLRCGYSLRKNLDAKFCPECGLAVWLSLNNNDALDASNPIWLRRLTLAAAALAAAQVAGLLLFLGLSPFVQKHLAMSAARAGAVACFIGGLYFIGYNVALLTLVWPERRYPDRLRTHRIATMIVAGFSFLVGLILLSGGIAGRVRDAEGLAFWLNAVLLADAAATFAYLYRLARRIPNSLLARLCGYLMLLPLLAFAKSFPFFAVFLAFEALHFLQYLPWAYLPISTGLLIWFAIIFRKSAKSAAEHWAAETAPTGQPVSGRR